MGPDRLDQLDNQGSIIPFSFISLALKVLLLQYGLEPHLDMFGTHARGSPCAAIHQFPCGCPNLAVQWNVIVDLTGVRCIVRGFPGDCLRTYKSTRSKV